ncbi:hypothetical protein [Aurantiacibacter spongiae]|uniref:Uncharacterized protein n=1 Tax=Aurantiacibacter spongiae TaxID=2488860 RepID=A0A3N5DQZ7_9SPHN|nr:hypothetical protein [Aurantiacibacter spongiae]RPF71551.1 hypothetical protein EG799_07910 [Aurantiacibacter spongiae]
MIDYFSIALTHGLILLAAWRLLLRGELDDDTLTPECEARGEPEDRRPWLANRAAPPGRGGDG